MNARRLSDIIEAARCRAVVDAVKRNPTNVEAAIELDIGVEHLRRLRHRYGLSIGRQGNASKRKLAA